MDFTILTVVSVEQILIIHSGKLLNKEIECKKFKYCSFVTSSV